MKIFTKTRQLVTHRWTRYPAGEWHFECDADCDVVVEATGLEPDFFPKAALVVQHFESRHRAVKLALPYFPAARGDREKPAPDVLAYVTLLGSMRWSSVHCFDPHSDVGPRLLAEWVPTVVSHMPTKAVAAAVRGLAIAGVIAPDKGAVGRATAVAQYLDVPLVTATKVRDPATGRLSDFQAPALPEYEGRWLVVDDICDGGGTFVGLARALGLPKERLHLWVSHAIFSGNARQLIDHYGWIYTTNSFPSIHTLPCTIVRVQDHMPGLYEQTNS